MSLRSIFSALVCLKRWHDALECLEEYIENSKVLFQHVMTISTESERSEHASTLWSWNQSIVAFFVENGDIPGSLLLSYLLLASPCSLHSPPFSSPSFLPFPLPLYTSITFFYLQPNLMAPFSLLNFSMLTLNICRSAKCY